MMTSFYRLAAAAVIVLAFATVPVERGAWRDDPTPDDLASAPSVADPGAEAAADLAAASADAATEAGAPGPDAAADAGEDRDGTVIVAALPPDGGLAARDDAGLSPSADASALKRFIDLYRKGDIAGGDNARAAITDPVARALLEWIAIRHNGKALGFERITSFLKNHPDWPAAALTRRRAEEALLDARRSNATVRAFFAERGPVSAAGKLALARALKTENKDEDAAALARSAWREDPMSRDVERAIGDSFGAVLSRVDHRQRMERLLFKEEWEAALRVAGAAGADYVALAKARMAVARKAGNAAALVDAVPASVRSDSSYVFARMVVLLRKNKFAEAAKALVGVSRDPAVLVDGDEWWTQRRILARKLLDERDPATAYRVVSEHGAGSAPMKIEAEFHAGWIALRFLHDPGAAARHFATAARFAETPISVARVAYWRARTAEVAGDAISARQHYERAARQTITYYGQLARAKLGLQDLPLRRPIDRGPAALDQVEAAQAIRLLYEAGASELAGPIFIDLAQHLTDPGQLDALADLAAHYRDARLMVLLGKAATQRGHPLDTAAFPTFGIPAYEAVGEPVEKPMIYAIARQESIFDPQVVSSAGARGLMQLMPATAKRTADRSGIRFDPGKLTSDPSYNVKIGATHLRELVKEWGGSYILTFAAYNAGGGNVKKWIAAYGDPRSDKVDPIDWVERIPFSETRNYVQRVMENLQVYRRRLNERTALLIDNDLRRGARLR